MYFSLLVPAYSIIYFLPTIVQSLGYNTIQTQLRSVPPFAAAFGFVMVLSYLSDKYRVRSPFIFLGLALLLIGLSVLISVHGTEHFSAQYGAICLTAMGSLGIGGILVCWYVMNLHGHVDRGIGSAWMICFGNCGGIVSTFIFLRKDAPYYYSGYSICLAMTAVCVVSSACYLVLVWRERRSDRSSQVESERKGHELYL